MVVSVSKPLLKDFKRLCKHDHFLEIKNGYDYEEVYDVRFQSQFTMAFIGRFYLGINPNNWFKLFQNLYAEGKLPTNCLIKIIGNNSKLVIPQNIAFQCLSVGIP